MTIVFHARLDERFIQIKHDLSRKKLHRTNYGSTLLLSVTVSLKFRSERQSHYLKR